MNRMKAQMCSRTRRLTATGPRFHSAGGYKRPQVCTCTFFLLVFLKVDDKFFWRSNHTVFMSFSIMIIMYMYTYIVFDQGVKTYNKKYTCGKKRIQNCKTCGYIWLQYDMHNAFPTLSYPSKCKPGEIWCIWLLAQQLQTGQRDAALFMATPTEQCEMPVSVRRHAKRRLDGLCTRCISLHTELERPWLK